MSTETSEFAQLPPTLKAERHGAVAVLRLNRASKRNALDDPMVAGIETFFSGLPEDIRAVVLCGEGEHFSAGLDLAELVDRATVAGIAHSRSWHRAFDRIEFGSVPVVAVLHGAVVGGGLEIAAACHIRVAEASAYYALPEGSRGIFVGGGGAVRLPRLIGTARMMDMMLTGRTYGAEEGQAIGISHYLVPPGAGLAKGIELAERITGNAPMTNFAVTHVLPRIAAADPAGGYVTEALISAIAQGDDEAKARLKAFLEKRAPKTVRN
jgi:enoyl-CoA hydratase/carnithine racemase